jgi:hypothetical protein
MTKLATRIVVGTMLCLPLVTPAFGQAPVPVPVPVPVSAPDSYQAPKSLMIPLGTFITVDITDRLSTDRSHPGDAFTAVLRQPIVVDGWVVARAGQTVIGRVVSVQKAGRIQGKAEIGLELGELILVDGQQVPIRTQLIRDQSGSSTDRDLGAIVATTAIGALIGAGVDGGSGAAIGAGVGAGAGVAGVLATPGESTRIYPERVLAFRLDDPVTISTARSQHAFLPATPADYAAVPAPAPQYVEQPVLYPAPILYPAPTVVAVPYGYPRHYRRY